MATAVEEARGRIAAAHTLLVEADAILDALSASSSAPGPEAVDEPVPGACEHPPAKREDISGFGEVNGARYRCQICGAEVKMAA